MFRFDGFTLDVARNALRTADGEVALRPKSFELLRYLVENPDRLVTKEELLKAIWPNVTVTDQALTHCVSEVREAIGDGEQTIIKTIPRRGYRFAASVGRVAASVTGPPAGTPSPLGPQGGGQPISAGAPAAGPDSGPSFDRPCVAVLPFANLSGDPRQDYFSDGITEDITTELSRFSELLVIARNSAFQYKGKAVDIRQVGRDASCTTHSRSKTRWPARLSPSLWLL
jgi:DNA-binding winged helix-turn-helix (wHTH) protein